MSPRAALLVLPLLACTRAGDPPRPTDMSQPPARTDAPDLAGYPLSRLTLAHNPVEPLEFAFDPALLAARKIRSARAFTATTPRVWLLVFEFAAQSDLLDALQDPGALVPNAPPYYTATAFTGPWLLVTGFPSEKPVSPEMEAARTIFMQRWAGEE